MPSRPPHACAIRTCPELTQDRYCQRHSKQAQQQHDRLRDTASERGYDARWQRIRAVFLKAHPFCECDEHKDKINAPVATEVHHLVPLAKGGTHDWTNLLAVSKPCHSRITIMESGYNAD